MLTDFESSKSNNTSHKKQKTELEINVGFEPALADKCFVYE